MWSENIALSDIESISYYEFDEGATIAAGLIIIGIGGLLYYEATTLKIY